MAEGFDPGEAPTRRGRRDPELQRQLLGANELGDAGDDQDETSTVVYEGLSQGAMIISKLTIEQPQKNGERIWGTYGATDHILPGETTEGAYERLVGHVVDGALGQINALNGVLEEAENERRSQRRATRIVPARETD